MILEDSFQIKFSHGNQESDPSTLTRDQVYMQLALDEAKTAFQKGEVPVGAVIVLGDQVIATAHNQVEQLQDASAHAEMLCLRRAAEKIGNWRLNSATLYCTLEPCTMCAGAMFLYRPDVVVWGACDLRHGAHGSWVDLLSQPHPTHHLTVRRGVLQEEASQLMREFFRRRRIE